MSSGTQDAKQKFMSSVEQTRAPVDDKTKQAGQPASGGDNPKAGGSSLRSIAKGDTNSSNYDPAKGPST
ncbi:uncharacterized protein F4822DRAFT_411365 [Hypoxylon trugodes]|uniref:uncharacterized protein n=1 Tax=Hypoxylon trugodes TaxID=326681 RepID=UPI002191F2E1|nr:uncharacterized protein F4822DRAFT_411365 [Hypoxylon trugodes]KAI1386839.1 hypothetical protein F4822DRAFT_411365 [Hypoxylon trugodes]